jgi:hypothetical protein
MTQNEAAANAAADWWTERLMGGDRQKFRDSLRANVLADLNATGRCYLECDYDPQKHLLTAARDAGLECRGFMFSARGILPQKHSLDVTPDKLEPKEGYGNWTDAIQVPKVST